MQWTPFLLVILGVEIVQSEEDSKCLRILPAERVRCGDPGTNKSRGSCLDEGCCFNDTMQDPFVPTCFVGRPLPPPPTEGPSKRPSEGPTGRPTGGPTKMPSQMSMPASKRGLKCKGIPPEERQRCGNPGIKQKRCKNKGCCFRRGRKGPECFHGRPMMPPPTQGPSMRPSKGPTHGSPKGPTKGPSSKPAPTLAIA